MTRKYYQKFAEILRNNSMVDYGYQISGNYSIEWNKLVEKIIIQEFSAFFKSNNPKFDEERFKKECGVEE